MKFKILILYQILIYEDINFVTPHYQSVRPILSLIESPESSSQDLPQNRPSMFSRLIAMSNGGNTTRYIQIIIEIYF